MMNTTMLRNLASAAAVVSWLVVAPGVMAGEPGAPQQGSIDSVQKETAEAIEALKQYSAAQRAQALTRAKILLDEIDTRIAKLKQWTDRHWDSTQTAAHQHAQELLSRLEAQRADLAKAYAALEASSGSAWEDLKQGFLKSYRTMSHTFDKTENEL